MKPKRRRLYLVIAALITLGAASALILNALEENIVFFYTPSDLAEKQLPPGQRVRIGGLVEEESVVRYDGEARVTFRITDLSRAVPVTYTGILPDLFRESQGVVAEGSFTPDGTFKAEEVLAKHDENYMPPAVAEALKKSGRWQGEETP